MSKNRNMSFIELPDDIMRIIFKDIITDNRIITDKIITDNSVEAMMNVYLTCKTLHKYCDRILTFADFDLLHFDDDYQPMYFKYIRDAYLTMITNRIISIKTIITQKRVGRELIIKYEYQKAAIRNVMRYCSKITNDSNYEKYLQKILINNSWRLKLIYFNGTIHMQFKTIQIHRNKGNIRTNVNFTFTIKSYIDLVILLDIRYYYSDCDESITGIGDAYDDIMFGLEFASKKNYIPISVTKLV